MARSWVVLSLLAVCAGSRPGVARGAGGPPASTPGSGHGNGRGTTGSSSGKGRIVVILPDGTLRELCTSFTQVTESPFTIGDGKLEIAAGEVSASAARLDTIRANGVDVGGIGLARGFAHRWEFGATLNAWSGLGLTTGPVTGEANPGGFGGGALVARHTLFGVDSTGVAMGLVATLTLPGSSTSPLTTAYGGAFAVPVSVSLPFDVTLGAMAQVATLADAEGVGHHLRFVDSIKLDRSLVSHVSGWVELVSIVDREPGFPLLTTANGGLSVDVGKHVGVSLGVAAGRGGGTTDRGVFGGVGLHR